MLLVLALVLQVFIAWAGAWLLAQKRSRWSRTRIVLTASVPVPLLTAASFAYIAGYDRLVRSVDEVPFDGAYTLVLGTVVLFCIGVVPAAVAARRSTRSEDLTDIFQ